MTTPFMNNEQMTPEQLRVEVCGCLGWTCLGGCDHPDYPGWVKKGETHPDGMRVLPPLTLDLMHEAVKTLSVNEWTPYLDELEKLFVPVHICPTTHTLALTEATAEQRARAFLKAKGGVE